MNHFTWSSFVYVLRTLKTFFQQSLYHSLSNQFRCLKQILLKSPQGGLMRTILPVFFFFFFFFFIYLWLCWVFISVRGLSLVVASGGHSSSRCAGLSLPRPLLLQSTGSRRAGSVIVAHRPSCSTACGIFPDQGSNLCPLHWQADSQQLHHQVSPTPCVLDLITGISQKGCWALPLGSLPVAGGVNFVHLW